MSSDCLSLEKMGGYQTETEYTVIARSKVGEAVVVEKFSPRVKVSCCVSLWVSDTQATCGALWSKS